MQNKVAGLACFYLELVEDTDLQTKEGAGHTVGGTGTDASRRIKECSSRSVSILFNAYIPVMEVLIKLDWNPFSLHCEQTELLTLC